MMRRAIICALLSTLLAVPGQARSLIAQSYEAGSLDYETALLYEVYAVREPAFLPAELQPSPKHLHPRCGTPVFVTAVQAAPELSPSYRAKLAHTLQRPTRPNNLITPSGRFRIHYELDGRHAVDPADEDGNGIPDYVDETAATLDRAWNLEVEQLGYRAPLEDGSVGGGSEYDIYITDLSGAGVYGYTLPELSGNTTPAYIEIDNNFTDAIYSQTRGLDALHVTLAHELFHGIQFAYYAGRNGLWWQEASATWMEEIAYPDVDDYLQYVPSVLHRPERALSSGNFTVETRIYGSAIFAHFLAQRFDSELIRAVWEEMGVSNHARLVNFERAIRQWTTGGLGAAIGEYAVWNYFTGVNHRVGLFYEEGDKYGEVRSRILQTAAKIADADSGQVDHTGSAYLRLKPVGSGGLALQIETPEGSWQRQLLLVSPDSVEVVTADENTIEIRDWQRFDEIVVVLTSIEQNGTGFEYTVRAEYDSKLRDDDPSSVVFRLGQNRPNPFKVSKNAETVISYTLRRATTNAKISIFSSSGELVRVLQLGYRSARSHNVVWNGTNQNDETVASGIYYYFLEADGEVRWRAMALMRE